MMQNYQLLDTPYMGLEHNRNYDGNFCTEPNSQYSMGMVSILCDLMMKFLHLLIVPTVI